MVCAIEQLVARGFFTTVYGNIRQPSPRWPTTTLAVLVVIVIQSYSVLSFFQLLGFLLFVIRSRCKTSLAGRRHQQRLRRDRCAICHLPVGGYEHNGDASAANQPSSAIQLADLLGKPLSLLVRLQASGESA